MYVASCSIFWSYGCKIAIKFISDFHRVMCDCTCRFGHYCCYGWFVCWSQGFFELFPKLFRTFAMIKWMMKVIAFSWTYSSKGVVSLTFVFLPDLQACLSNLSRSIIEWRISGVSQSGCDVFLIRFLKRGRCLSTTSLNFAVKRLTASSTPLMVFVKSMLFKRSERNAFSDFWISDRK